MRVTPAKIDAAGMTLMNVIVNATCLAANYCTGIERYACRICQELYHIDSSITFLSSTPISGIPDSKIPTVLMASRRLFGNYEYYVRSVWDQTLFTYSIFRKITDVVFFPIQDGMLFPPVKQIITVHDLHYFHFNGSVAECKQEIPAHRRFFYRFKMPHILKRSAAVIAVSESTKQDIVECFGISPDKIHVIYNGYDEERFRIVEDTQPVLIRYGLRRGGYFLFVGSILRHKNIVRLVHAFAKLKGSHRLIVAGANKDTDYLSEILSCAHELGFSENRFRYLEFVPDTDLPSLYNGAAAFVLPSLHEGFGVPIIEAMACGTPVITSSCSAMPEVAGDAALLVDPYSVESIASAMREIIDNPQKAETLRSAGLERAKMFRWSYSAEKLYDLCRSVSES